MSATKSNLLIENAEQSLTTFDDTVALTKLRYFEGEDIKKVKSSTLSDISSMYTQEMKRERVSTVTHQDIKGLS